LFPLRQVLVQVINEEEDNTIVRHKPAAASRSLVGKVRPCFGLAAGPEVVILMGLDGAGKSHLARSYMDRGYFRLERESRQIVTRLQSVLAARHKLVVLDGVYPTRLSRAGIVAAARAHGCPCAAFSCRSLSPKPR